MLTLTMLEGLPGSGKSTWAAQAKQQGLADVIINKDTIRRELESEGWQWSPENEKDVIARRDELIESTLSGGLSVISDDTNLARKHKVRLLELATQYGAEFKVKRFDTPVDECVRRDALRTGKARVGEKVITDMAARFGLLQGPAEQKIFAPYEGNRYLPSAIICDLDGTLCLNNGYRSHYDASECAEDELNLPVRKVIEAFYRFLDYRIIYLSGREEKYRQPTEKFFRKHHIPPGPLWMRATGDRRKDWIVKGELFDAHIRGKYDVIFILDDRDQVVKFWRGIGLTVFQVADGAF